MKLDDKALMQLLSEDRINWEGDDLEWIDRRVAQQTIEKQTAGSSREQLSQMVAEDPAVAERYLLMRRSIKKSRGWTAVLERTREFMTAGIPARLATAAVLVLAVLLVVIYRIQPDFSPIETDLTRGTDVASSPVNFSVLDAAPVTFTAPLPANNASRLILFDMEKSLIWESGVQLNPEFRLPEDIRNSLVSGTYFWIVISRHQEAEFSGREHQFTIR